MWPGRPVKGRNAHAGRGVRAVGPLVAVGLQAGPVPVRDRGHRPGDALVRRADRVRDRRPDAVGADDEPGPHGQAGTVAGPGTDAGDGAVPVPLQAGDRDTEPYVGTACSAYRKVVRRTGGVPAAMTASSRPQRLSWRTPPRISACVDSVSAPY